MRFEFKGSISLSSSLTVVIMDSKEAKDFVETMKMLYYPVIVDEDKKMILIPLLNMVIKVTEG